MTTSPPGTSVKLAATFDYNGTPIPVNTGDLASIKQNGIVFRLSQPVVLGSIEDFVDWLHSEFGIPVSHTDIENLVNAVPESPGFLKGLHDALEGFFTADISITALEVNTKLKQWLFGVTMTMNPPLDLFAGLRFDSIGVAVSHGDTSSP